MNQKLVAYVLVFLLAFVLCLRLLEASNLVAVSVDTQVSAGHVEVGFAPRLARLLEMAAAAVIALFITTGRIGDFAAAGLVSGWHLLRSRISKTIARESPNSDGALDEVLTEHDIRLSNIEAVIDRKSPLDRVIDDRVNTIDERLTKFESVLIDVQNKHNALVERTRPHKAAIAELTAINASLDARIKLLETPAAPAARARSTRKKAGE